MSVTEDKPFRFQLAFNETPLLDYFAERMPWLLSPKIDGIRAGKLEQMPQLVSRTLKPFPSAYVHKTFALDVLNGFDGELLVRKQHGPTIYHDTYSAVMTEGSMEPVDWWIFDYVDYGVPYHKRQEIIQLRLCGDYGLRREVSGLQVVEQRLCYTMEEFVAYEQQCLDQGFEGMIARDPIGLYLGNRSSLKQRNLIKVVRKIRFEAEVIGMEEMMHNDNEATIDTRGYTVRSSHKANQRPAGMCGRLVLRKLDSDVVFRCGTGKGFDHTLRKAIFDEWPKHKGWIAVVECKPYGEKDLPRQPSWIGWRDPIDMDER